MRLLPDGRPLQIVVETAGEETEQTDVLELIRDDWRKIGIGAVHQADAARGLLQPHQGRLDADGGLDGAGERLAEAAHQPGGARAAHAEQFQWPAWGLWAQTQRPGGRGARSRRRSSG